MRLCFGKTISFACIGCDPHSPCFPSPLVFFGLLESKWGDRGRETGETPAPRRAGALGLCWALGGVLCSKPRSARLLTREESQYFTLLQGGSGGSERSGYQLKVAQLRSGRAFASNHSSVGPTRPLTTALPQVALSPELREPLGPLPTLPAVFDTVDASLETYLYLFLWDSSPLPLLPCCLWPFLLRLLFLPPSLKLPEVFVPDPLLFP